MCTLLSNEGRHTLKLGKCPRLLDILLAHAGVFNHHNLRDYVADNYQAVRSLDQIRFWRDVCKEKNVLDLIYDERNFYPKNDNLKDKAGKGENGSDDFEELTGRERIAAMKARAVAELEDIDDDELFCTGRQNGTKELTGQRVLQVATIIRNLSFEDDNSPVLAKNLTCLRFVLLCVNSSWANLNQMGFDILSNIASNVQLEEPSEDAVTDLLLTTLKRCIGAPDRFQVISSLDVLSKLCGLESNEDFIQRLLEGAVYSRLVEYLSLHDIHLLITVLECLYSLTSLGEVPCTALVRTHSAVELLVSLVTVEAQSYGPKACILMRVVETVPGTTAVGTGAATASPVPGTSGVVATSGGSTQITRVSAPALPTQPLPQPAVSNILPRHPVPLASRPPGPAAAGGQPPTSASPGPAVAAVRPSGPPGSQQVQLRVSNDEPHRAFCLSWLKATYEPSGGKSIEQNIMYKQYLASMHRMGRKEVISAQHYALCIRTLFGGSTGPNKKQVGDRVENHYTGIQVREHPLPLKLTPAQAAAAQEASRQQQAAAVPPPAPAQNGVSQAPVQQQVVQTQGGQQRIVSTNQGQQIIVNAQGQQILTSGQIIQAGGPGQAQKLLVNAQGQQILVNSSNSGGQVIQVNPGTNIVNSGGQLIVNQAGQVVQQRIVSGQGAIVAQGLVQGQVISSGFQNRNAVASVSGTTTATSGGQQIPLGQVIQRIVHPGGRVEEKVVGTTGGHTGGQIVLHGPGGQQHVVQAQPQQGQVILQQQPQQQQQQQPVSIQPQPQPTQKQQPGVIQSGQTIVASNTPVQVIASTTGGQGTNGGQPQVVKTQVKSGEPEMLENGLSPLDGILPKDPKFGVLEGDMVNELLEKSENNIVMNGAVNHIEGGKMNGDIGNKRLLGEYVDNSPAKKQALEGGNIGVVVTNGGHGNGSLNGGGMRLPVASSGGGQLVQNSQGQIFLKTQSPSGGVVLQPAGQAGQAGGQLIYQGAGEPQSQNKIVLLQQHQHQRSGQLGQPQQTVVRVSAPVAQVAAPGTAPASGDHLPQVDGAADTEDRESSGESVPQVDGTTVEPVTSTQHPEPQQSASPGPSQQPHASVIQPRPATISAVQTSASQAESDPSSSPPPNQQASPVKIDTQKPFLCEWQGCMKPFKTPKEVENHAIGSHCPLGADDIPCLWARCDGMKRKRFSLMTHLQDRHCHPQVNSIVKT